MGVTRAPGVGEGVEAVRQRIAAAAGRTGRDPTGVRLIAVTKAVDVAHILEAVAAGITEIGENRVQEALAKRDQVGDGVRWHMIGHLQTNKAGRASELFDIVQSVDSERIATALAQRRPERRGDLEVLLEVELTGIAGHTGFTADTVGAALPVIAAIPGLELRGLMTMAPPVADLDQARATFARLRRLRDDLQQQSGIPLPELSMGMTEDFEVAVEEGATMVRVGRAIFGERPSPRDTQ